jgi:hypothetical protein
MKTKHIITGALLALIFAVSISISGCKKLNLQTSFSRSTTDTIDAHLYKTTWAYIKARAYGSTTDTIFRSLYTAIIYSGIDTNEYIKPDRTYLLLNTAACKSVWGSILVNGKKAVSWKSYSATDVKNYLLYLIVNGTYSHYNLPISPVTVQTLAPAGAYTTNPATFASPVPTGFPAGTPFTPNPNSVMTLYVLNALIGNTQSYPLVVNMSVENTTTINANTTIYTSDLLSTNGVVDVVNAAIWPTFY